ncbi:CdaR family protein [Leucobacter soli]|uniref:hypothetical protein n=1 Tax=Leucobacter soli TaxID=2812850 RepID=UPI00360BD9BE
MDAAAEHGRDARWTAETLRRLARAGRTEFDFSSIVSVLSAAAQTPVCVIDTRGSFLASTPSRAEWDADEILTRTAEIVGDGLVVHPLIVEGETVAFLSARLDHDPGGVCQFAADLISMYLSRMNARLEGKRELVAQVLEDFFAARLPEEDAARRLAEIGIDPGTDHRVICGIVDAPRSACDPSPGTCTPSSAAVATRTSAR